MKNEIQIMDILRIGGKKSHSWLLEGQDQGASQRTAGVSFISICGKVRIQLILETISMHMKDKKVVSSSQHGFTKGM